MPPYYNHHGTLSPYHSTTVHHTRYDNATRHAQELEAYAEAASRRTYTVEEIHPSYLDNYPQDHEERMEVNLCWEEQQRQKRKAEEERERLEAELEFEAEHRLKGAGDV
jgi:hypothetical protein